MRAANNNSKAPQLARRHYVFIAGVIQQLDVTKPLRRKLAKQFAAAFTVTNPRFNVEKFIEAATRSN